MREELSFRPIDSEDEEFLYRLYASTRTDVHATDLSDREKEQFLRMQFGAQSIHYQSHFPNAKFLVVQLDDVAIGRLYVDRRGDAIHIIDIALLPEYRLLGFGTELMADIFTARGATGRCRGKTSHHLRRVLQRYCEAMVREARLPRNIEDIQTHLHMEWRPDERDQ